MQAEFIHAGPGEASSIILKHGKQSLEFSGKVYQQAFKKGTFDPYSQINRYWSRVDKVGQAEIFDLFVEAKEIFNNFFKVDALILRLRPIMARLVEIHDTEDYERWARIHGSIWIPEELDHEYKYSHERPGSREQTYLVEDYWELVFMVLKLRCISPIWGEFNELTSRQSGPTFKDLNAFYLIKQTSIMGSPAMNRLQDYVNKNTKQEGINLRSSIDGIGSDVYQDNLIANTLVRFLAVSSLTRDPADVHLVQVIHKSIRNRLSQNDSHQNAILEKSVPNDNSDSEDSSSRAEIYKNKPLVAPGEITAIEKSTEYVNDIAARLLVKNELTKEEIGKLNTALDNAEKMVTHPFEACQIRLIQWTVSPIIPARALLDINKSSIIRLAGIAQFVLEEYGFSDLAGICTARSMNSEGFGQYGSESRAHIPKDLADKLNELYPYYRRNPNKSTLRQPNEAAAEIMKLSQELSNHTWYLNLSDETLEATRGSSVNKTYRTGYDIRILLSKAAIYLQERNKSFLSLFQFKN